MSSRQLHAEVDLPAGHKKLRRLGRQLESWEQRGVTHWRVALLSMRPPSRSLPYSCIYACLAFLRVCSLHTPPPREQRLAVLHASATISLPVYFTEKQRSRHCQLLLSVRHASSNSKYESLDEYAYWLVALSDM